MIIYIYIILRTLKITRSEPTSGPARLDNNFRWYITSYWSRTNVGTRVSLTQTILTIMYNLLLHLYAIRSRKPKFTNGKCTTKESPTTSRHLHAYVIILTNDVAATSTGYSVVKAGKLKRKIAGRCTTVDVQVGISKVAGYVFVYCQIFPFKNCLYATP